MDRKDKEIKLLNILIKGGRILDPSQGIDMTGDLLIRDSLISEISKDINPTQGSHLVEAHGLIVCPGFIDIHCHLREPGEEHKETIATASLAAAKGGFTTLCAMPNTNPPMDKPNILIDIQHKANEVGSVNILPIGCVTEGREGKTLTDMFALANAGAIGFSDDGNPIVEDDIMLEALLNAKYLGMPIINHCENPYISNNGVMNQGVVSHALGMQGWPSEAEEIMVERDIELSRQTGAKVHLAHISTAGSVELIRNAKAKGINVSAEATPHHLTLTEESVRGQAGTGKRYDTNAKVNPPLRTTADVDAVIQGLSDGTIDCVATDHAPHAPNDKNGTFEDAAFGISGLDTALGSLLSLVHNRKIPIETLIKSMTYSPASIVNKPDKCSGSLRVNTKADVTIFDPDIQWQVDTNLFASKGKNSPLDGVFLYGQVMATIVNGKFVHGSEMARIV